MKSTTLRRHWRAATRSHRANCMVAQLTMSTRMHPVHHTRNPTKTARTQPHDATQMWAWETACGRSGRDHADDAGEHERAVAAMQSHEDGPMLQDQELREALAHTSTTPA